MSKVVVINVPENLPCAPMTLGNVVARFTNDFNDGDMHTRSLFAPPSKFWAFSESGPGLGQDGNFTTTNPRGDLQRFLRRRWEQGVRMRILQVKITFSNASKET
ncbi:MAG: hypothetical protein LC808_17735, partial [Actinobacteria bacterium]|nr:hypothetical protein [Actinomycetota bacterium]